MNRICLIANPAAKSAKAGKFIRRLQEMTGGVTIKLTQGPGDAEALAERAVEQGYEVVVAAGGDGTVNEIVNGLANSPVALGLLPMGTINVFAMELGIPFDLDQAWRVIQRGKMRAVDLAMANDHYFVQLAGIGLDAQVVAQTHWESKKRLGPLSYLLTTTKVISRRPPLLRVHTDAQGVVEGAFVLVGNGRFYGGPLQVFPEADLEDGLLDVCVFKHMNTVALIRYIRGAIFGSHTTFTDVRYFQTRRLRIESQEPVPVEVDGELLGNLPCEFQINRRKLRVLVP